VPSTLTSTTVNGAELISAVAAESNEELASGLAEDFRQMSASQARFLVRLGEYDRRQAFRDEGATSLESWTAERFGVSAPTARTYARVGEKAWDIPELVGSLCTGELSFDKVRVVADVATPESDRALCDQAKEHSVRELVDIARSEAELARIRSRSSSRSEHDGRFLRFNDQYRTISAQLPAESYAEARACIEARAKDIPSDGETPWDHRRCDAFMGVIHSSGAETGGGATKKGHPFLVVAHVPLAALVEEASEGEGELSTLAGELERGGLIDGETVKRIACDATVAIAVDDDVGHTMYEGRVRRFPTRVQRREVMRRDRHCRFPGCTNVTFTNVHHVVPWEPDGRTDLDNLALTCLHHHHLVHSGGWTMSGNANEELAFEGPNGRVMTSRPSPLWTRVTSGPGSALSG
jgi:hypothetical protein